MLPQLPESNRRYVPGKERPLDDEFPYFDQTVDASGQSSRLVARVPSDMYREISIIVSTGRTPYRTPSDFVRTACYQLLKDIMTGRYPLDMADRSPWVRIETMKAMVDEQTRKRAFEELIQGIDVAVHDFVNRGDAEAARELVQHLMDQVDSFGDGSERNKAWRNQYKASIETRFGFLFR